MEDWKIELIDQARQEIEQKERKIRDLKIMLLVSVSGNICMAAGVIWTVVEMFK